MQPSSIHHIDSLHHVYTIGWMAYNIGNASKHIWSASLVSAQATVTVTRNDAPAATAPSGGARNGPGEGAKGSRWNLSKILVNPHGMLELNYIEICFVYIVWFRGIYDSSSYDICMCLFFKNQCDFWQEWSDLPRILLLKKGKSKLFQKILQKTFADPNSR